jgi:undecaprenyl-diphosphatase
LNWLQAAILGVVEGLTEYLPVSSTGHLILAARALGLDGEGAKSFEVVIQLGAILAVLVHYRALLGTFARELSRGGAAAVRLAAALAVAFAPAAVLGVLLHKAIKRHLFGPYPVAVALIAGGVLMIALERRRRARGVRGLDGLEHVTWRRALAIGLGQCVSMWPGSSRSMCTIVAGQLSGLSTSTAAEFSFLLALPTLGAATLYDLLKGREALRSAVGWAPRAPGLAVSFAVAWAVIAAFLRWLRTRGLEPFGWYRIALGAMVLWVMAR